MNNNTFLAFHFVCSLVRPNALLQLIIKLRGAPVKRPGGRGAEFGNLGLSEFVILRFCLSLLI